MQELINDDTTRNRFSELTGVQEKKEEKRNRKAVSALMFTPKGHTFSQNGYRTHKQNIWSMRHVGKKKRTTKTAQEQGQQNKLFTLSLGTANLVGGRLTYYC